MKKTGLITFAFALILQAALFLAACGSQPAPYYDEDSCLSVENTDADHENENIEITPECTYTDHENKNIDAEPEVCIQDTTDRYVPSTPLTNLDVVYVHPLYISVNGTPLFTQGSASSTRFNLQQYEDGTWVDSQPARGFFSTGADVYENTPHDITWESPLPVGEYRLSLALEHSVWPYPVRVRENAYVYFTVEREPDPIEMIMLDLRLFTFRAEVVTPIAYLYEWAEHYSEYLILQYLYPLQYASETEGFIRASDPLYICSEGERDTYLWWHRFYPAVALSTDFLVLNVNGDIIDPWYIPPGTIVDVWVNHHMFLDGGFYDFEVMYLRLPKLIRVVDN